MSKERELLKQAEELIHTISVMASIDGVRIPTNIGIALRLEIQGLLAQPEQPEQIDTRNGGKDVEGQIVLRL
jgi:methyl coenzyme M reductase gamma subunit